MSGIFKKISNQNFILLGITLSAFMIAFNDALVIISLPYIIESLSANFAISSWITISYLLVMSGSIIIFGRIGDLMGRKIPTMVGIIVFMAAAVACASAQSGIELVIYRAFQGLGSSMLASNIYAIPKDIFPAAKHGKSIGIITLGVYIALTIGPFVAGFLINISWRWIFLLFIPFGIASFIIVIISEFKPVKKSKEKFDFLGAITFSLMLFFLYLTLTFGNEFGWNSLIIIFLILFVALLVSFIIIEKRVQYPMIDFKDFKRNRNFFILNIIALLFYITTFSIAYLIPIYLKACLNYKPFDIALIIFYTPLMMSIFTIISGYLSDKFSNKKISLIGLIILSIPFLILGFIIFEQLILIGVFIMSGIGQGIFRTPNVNMILDSVEPPKRGMASSISSLMRTLGQSSSVALSTAILGIFIPFSLLNNILSGNYSPLPAEINLFLFGMQIVYLLMFLITGIALLLFLGAKKISKINSSNSK